MTLRLSIENFDRLPDGGPTRVEVRARGLDIGRDAHLDWTLPDPSRVVSGKHCEIRYREGGYWLHDVSTNGAYINGATFRVDGPYRLHSGDRIAIGPYIVGVEIEGAEAGSAPLAASSAPPPVPAGGDVWGAVGEVAAADDPRAYRPARSAPPPPDFLDFASPAPAGGGPVPPSFAPPPPPPPSEDWMNAAPAAPPVAPVAAPSPRRPTPAEPPPFAAPPDPAFSPAPAASDALARIAAAAGLPARVIAGRDPNELADEIGAVLRLTAQNLAQLLSARAETKSMIRSSSRTLISALDNNPLKHTTTPEEALAIMFGPKSRSYLDAKATVQSSFADLKAHQMTTFQAIPMALESLFEDLSPDRIDKSVEPDKGISALVGSRKAKLWDIFIERWRAKSRRADGRLNEAFASAFAEAYDRLQRGG